jgi:cytidylate kinase
MKKITIAIDGHSSCGKSTMAKDLAREIGYIYIDSGAMYRAVTYYCLQHNLFTEDSVKMEELQSAMSDIRISFSLNAEGRPETYLNGECIEKEIRGMAVSSRVSLIATIGFVREAMVSLQQEMGKEKGIVMDGRDIGTTVFPDAELKIFVTASAEVRAQRRYDAGQELGLKFFGRRAGTRNFRNFVDKHADLSLCLLQQTRIVTLFGTHFSRSKNRSGAKPL